MFQYMSSLYHSSVKNYKLVNFEAHFLLIFKIFRFFGHGFWAPQETIKLMTFGYSLSNYASIEIYPVYVPSIITELGGFKN